MSPGWYARLVRTLLATLVARSLRAAVLRCCSLLLLETGCSFATVRPLRPSPPGEVEGNRDLTVRAQDCTASVAAPVFDTVLAVPYLALTALAVSALVAPRDPDVPSTAPDNNRGPAGIYAVVAGAGTIGLTASAWYGYSKTSECREARRKALVASCVPGDPFCARLSLPPPQQFNWAMGPLPVE